MTPRGTFIVFEGGEGAGKSTQERLLAEHLVSSGHDVLRTREPGGTAAAERIRAILLDPASAGLDVRAEALLFAAARGDHVAQVIRTALQAGTTVICDRYLDSSVAYQGYGRQMDPDRIRELSLWATSELLPDLTIILDIDPRVGLAR
ncbi:MAG: dTMP kinase, partial [Actinomycetales bacterium]